MTELDEAPPLAPKVDPETLELRGAPRRVVRFRRGLLIAAAAALSAGIAGVAWLALQPVSLKLAAQEGEDGAPAAAREPGGLDRLPTSYGETVPKLGPPLPGDLGRPILEQQRAMATEDSAPPPAPAVDPAAAERQRRETELAQARGAPVLMQVSRNAMQGAVAAPAPAGDAIPPKDDFANPARLRPPASRWQLAAGSVISASLLTGLNSDLPGMVVAQVTEPAFDSATGRTMLVPQGARLLGHYASAIAFGQRRAMVVWDRLVMPSGPSIALDNAPATDAAGYAGLNDGVDAHTWQLLKGIGFSTLLGVGTQLTFGSREGDLVRALRESIQSNANGAGQKIVEKDLEVAPTITVRPGFPVRVLVHKDLVLPPWRD